MISKLTLNVFDFSPMHHDLCNSFQCFRYSLLTLQTNLVHVLKKGIEVNSSEDHNHERSKKKLQNTMLAPLNVFKMLIFQGKMIQ